MFASKKLMLLSQPILHAHARLQADFDQTMKGHIQDLDSKYCVNPGLICTAANHCNLREDIEVKLK